MTATNATFSATWAATDNVAVTAYQIRTKRGATGTWSATTSQTTTTKTFSGLTAGTWYIDVRARDAATNVSGWREVTLIVDSVAPTMTALSAPGLVTSANAAFTATFSGSDNVAVTAYQIRTKKGATGTWSATATQTARSRAFSGLAAGTWYIDLRARGAVGNLSAWREAVVVIPTDDRAWSFSAGTLRWTNSVYLRSTVTTTLTYGAKMTIKFSGNAFYLIGSTGRYYGKLRVTLDGTSYTVDTGYYKGVRETGNHYRVLLFSKSLTNGSHAVTITCLATYGRRTIGIDAAGWRN